MVGQDEDCRRFVAVARSGVDLLQQLVATLQETCGALQRARIKGGRDVSSFFVAVNVETVIGEEVRR